jgi:hypothetical protein
MHFGQKRCASAVVCEACRAPPLDHRAAEHDVSAYFHTRAAHFAVALSSNSRM